MFDVGLLLAVALVVSSLGFVRLVYFVSLGYGLSMTAMSVLLLARDAHFLGPWVLCHVVGLGLYGLRLSGYLLVRERSPSYRQELQDVQARAVGIGVAKKFGIWFGVSLLYVLMFSPALFAVHAGVVESPWPPLGVGLMLAGFLLESAADAQKSAYKRTNPSRYCDVGLYAWVRCPNYLGEIVFWVGTVVAGVSSYATAYHWASALTGLVCITLIMVGSTKRLEAKQAVRYGSRADYQKYSTTVPVLFPFVPVYSLRNVRVYLE